VVLDFGTNENITIDQYNPYLPPVIMIISAQTTAFDIHVVVNIITIISTEQNKLNFMMSTQQNIVIISGNAGTAVNKMTIT
jgi:hypothetical protein